MGYLTDLVIARREDLAEVAETEGPCRRWEGLPDAGLDDGMATELFCVLTDREGDDAFDNADELMGKECRDSKSHPGAFALIWPDEFTRKLAAIGEAEIPVVASTWMGHLLTSESGWSTDQAVALLKRLQDLAARALKSGCVIIYRAGE